MDSHMHLGDCRVFGCNVTEENLKEAMEKYQLSGFILQPYPGASDEAEVHKRIYHLTQMYPGQIFGVASVNPHMDEKQYKAKIRKYITEYHFKAVKLHTIGHAVHPFSRDAHMVAETAAELGVPVNVHTGPGVPFSLPSLLMPLVKEFPDTRFILAHSGARLYFGEALLLARECANVFLEMSWCSAEDVDTAIRSLGSGRVMFGSDSLMNIGPGMDVFRRLDLGKEDQENVFYYTAAEAFSLL